MCVGDMSCSQNEGEFLDSNYEFLPLLACSRLSVSLLAHASETILLYQSTN